MRQSGLRIALVEPDMAPNVGAILRLGACLGVPVDIIEPCGFPFSPRAWRRQAMDYADLAEIERHESWAAFLSRRAPGRLVAMTTSGAEALSRFCFRAGDTLLMGREGAGLPASVHEGADARVVISMQPGARSLNIGMAAAIAAAEALRQIAAAPPEGVRLRRGRVEDIPALRSVEAEAATLYGTVGYNYCVGGPVRDEAEHLRGIAEGALLVAEDASGLLGFALLWVVDERAHLTELAVAAPVQGRGIGRALIGASICWARAGLFPEVTLTTYRDVPWNAPLYARIGWREIAVGPDRPGLCRIVAEDRDSGYARWPRAAMALKV